jgi:hypothetical protein
MRISAFVRHLPLFLAFTSPAFLLAQFQQPTGEELKMTADPKAPGAAAVFLNVEEVTDNQLHFYSFYARIKVLTEKGKDLASVTIPYEFSDYEVTSIKARTIHSDGSVIPLAGKPEDLLISKTTDKKGDQSQLNRKVFTLPSVEVGSILEYRYEVRYGSSTVTTPRWVIQRPYFVHKAHYAFIPFTTSIQGSHAAMTHTLTYPNGDVAQFIVWWPILPPGVSVKMDSAGRFSVDLTDIPPQPDEEYMPPVESTVYKVYFYYSSAANDKEFWASKARIWSKEVDRFAEPSKPIKDAVAGLIAPTDSDLDKVKKLYKAVQALDNTDFSRNKTESEMKRLKLKAAKHAEDTWAQKSGSSQDIALLYLAMLRAAGFTAYDMKVVDRSERVFALGYLNFDQLDDDIIFVNVAGKGMLLDPGEKMCPFQTLHWKHSASTGILQDDKDRTLSGTAEQPYTTNRIVRAGDITIASQGEITGHLSIIMSGQEALYWRQTALRNDPDELKKQFDRGRVESLVPEGVEAHIDHFLGLDNPDTNLIAFVDVKGSLGTATSKRLLLPAFFLETRGKQPFVAQEKRAQPVDMRYGNVVSDQITYHLPDGFTVEGIPQDAQIPWAGHANFVTKAVSAPGKITIARSLATAFTFAKPEEYQDLRAFYQKVAAADQAQLVLAKSAPAPAPGSTPASPATPPAPNGN